LPENWCLPGSTLQGADMFLWLCTLLLSLSALFVGGLDAGVYHKDTLPGETRVALKISSSNSSIGGPTVERKGYVCSVRDPVWNALNELHSFRLTMTKAGSSSVDLLFRVLDKGRIESRERKGGGTATWSLALRRVAEVAIIIDAADEQQRKEASKFASTHLKRLILRGVPIRKWGSVVAKGLECPTYQPNEINPTHWPDKIVGITMAHKRIWEDFAARNANQTSSDNSPFLVIFEKDAMCAVEGCGNHALKAIQGAKEDLVYLGWCWQKLQTGNFPRCAHAYAVSVRGAKFLNEFVEICNEHVDYQMAVAEEKALISWKLIEPPSDARPLFNSTVRITHGLFIQDWR